VRLDHLLSKESTILSGFLTSAYLLQVFLVLSYTVFFKVGEAALVTLAALVTSKG
jgi:hypothetical protein